VHSGVDPVVKVTDPAGPDTPVAVVVTDAE
jgi:hypothetical protein